MYQKYGQILGRDLVLDKSELPNKGSDYHPALKNLLVKDPVFFPAKRRVFDLSFGSV